MTFADLSPWANHLWQSTLFAAVAWLLTLALRKNRAAVRYWVWLAASVKFLIPFSLLVSAGAQLGWRTAPAAVQPRFSFVMEEIAQPFAAAAPTPLPAVAAAALNPLPAILFGVWLCGVAIGAVFWLRWWRRIRAIQRAATPLPLNLPIRVMSSTARLEPGVVGIVKPVLLLPEGIADCLTPPQLEAILAHELRHVQRRDNLTAAIHMVVETLFWFHPLVWWIRGRLVEERELACDEGVLRLGSEPQVYAESILKVCEFYLASPVVCAAGVTGGELKKRIEGIMANCIFHKLNFAQKLLLAAAAIGALGGPIAVGLAGAPRAQSEAQAVAAANTLRAEGPAMAVPQTGRAAQPPAASPAPQAPPRPAFEVASIKLAADCERPVGSMSPGRILLPCVTVRSLIDSAYGRALTGNNLNPQAIRSLGGPAWIDKDRFTINAKAEGNASVPEMIGPMFQTLLEDRFNLKVHSEFQDTTVFALTAAKGGAKLQPTKEGTCTPLNVSQAPRDPAVRICGPDKTIFADGIQTLSFIGVTMDEFCSMNLSRFVRGFRVVNMTGLAGRFDIRLEFAAEPLPAGAMLNGVPAPAKPDDPTDSAPPGAPSIFTALRQLGLQLSQQKQPVEVIVIDRIEKPLVD